MGANHKAIRIVNIDSGTVESLLEGPAIPVSDHVYDYHHGLTWSRDGSIVFNSQVQSLGSKRDVLRLDPESKKVTSVTDFWEKDPGFIAPACSPINSQIVAVRIDHNSGTHFKLYLIDEPSILPLSEPTHGNIHNPRWFRDGRRILYSAGPSIEHQIFVVPVKGGKPTRLTQPGSDNRDPDVWSAPLSR